MNHEVRGAQFSEMLLIKKLKGNPSRYKMFNKRCFRHLETVILNCFVTLGSTTVAQNPNLEEQILITCMSSMDMNPRRIPAIGKYMS
jgi:hypothetical protein